MGGVAIPKQLPNQVWDPGISGVSSEIADNPLGRRVQGYIVTKGVSLPVDFDTDSSICICPEDMFNIYFKKEELLSYDAQVFDVQDLKIPISGVVNIAVDGITSLWGTKIEVPLNVVVPFAVIGKVVV